MVNEINEDLIKTAKSLVKIENDEDLLLTDAKNSKGIMFAEDHSYLEGLEFQLEIMKKLDIGANTDFFMEGSKMPVRTQNGMQSMGQYEYLSVLRNVGDSNQLQKEYKNFHEGIVNRYTGLGSNIEDANKLADAQIDIIKYALENGANLITLDVDVHRDKEFTEKHKEFAGKPATKENLEEFNKFMKPYREATNNAWADQIDISQQQGKNVIIKSGYSHKSISENEMPVLNTTTPDSEIQLANSSVIKDSNEYKFTNNYQKLEEIERDNTKVNENVRGH